MCLILMYFFFQTPFLPRVLCVHVWMCVWFLSHLFNCSHLQRRQRVILSLSFSLSLPPSFALNACPGDYTAFLSFFFGFVSMSVCKSPISFYHSVTVSLLTTRGWSFSPRSPDGGFERSLTSAPVTLTALLWWKLVYAWQCVTTSAERAGFGTALEI